MLFFVFVLLFCIDYRWSGRFIYLFYYTTSVSLVLWFPPPTNKTDRQDITEILLKVTLNTIALILTPLIWKRINYLVDISTGVLLVAGVIIGHLSMLRH